MPASSHQLSCLTAPASHPLSSCSSSCAAARSTAQRRKLQERSSSCQRQSPRLSQAQRSPRSAMAARAADKPPGTCVASRVSLEDSRLPSCECPVVTCVLSHVECLLRKLVTCERTVVTCVLNTMENKIEGLLGAEAAAHSHAGSFMIREAVRCSGISLSARPSQVVISGGHAATGLDD